MHRRFLVALLAALAVLLPGALPAGADAPFDLLHAMNQARLAEGLEPLVEDPALTAVASDWSARLAAAGTLRHRPDLMTALAIFGSTWERAGENVGRGSSLSNLHTAFLASPSHRVNVLGPFTRVGIGVRDVDGQLWVTVNFLDGRSGCGRTGGEAAGGPAWQADIAGRVIAAGGAPAVGDVPSRDVVAAAARRGGGLWVAGGDGGVFALGGAPFLGSIGSIASAPLPERIVDLVPTPSGQGYWLIGARGGVFTFGDAAFLGSAAPLRLRAPIVAGAATPTGRGYWLLGRDGGVFTFGDAGFFGSVADRAQAHPAVAVVPTPGGRGYWLVTRDGGVFTFGDATFHGAPAAVRAAAPMVDAVATATGYLVLDGSGRRWSFSSGGATVTAPTCVPTAAAALPA